MSQSWEQVLLIRVTRTFAVARCVHVLCPSLAVSRRVRAFLGEHYDPLTMIDWSTTADAVCADAEREVFVGEYGDMCILHERVALLAPNKLDFFSEAAAVLVDYDRFSIGNVLCLLRSDDGDIVSQSDICTFLGTYKHFVEVHMQGK